MRQSLNFEVAGIWRTGQLFAVINKQSPSVVFVFGNAPTNLVATAMNRYVHLSY
jgi:precorrin isomerase